jgi:hypothetical protein
MKISKIKKKLDKLFGGSSKAESDSVENMRLLVELLKEKEIKLKEKKEKADDEEVQVLKRKLKLIKKQLFKACEYIDSKE